MHYFYFTFSQPASRDTKRLDATARSHIYSGVMEQVNSVYRPSWCKRILTFANCIA